MEYIHYILDIVLVLVIVFGTIIGAKKGFIQLIFKTGARLIAILSAIVFTKSLAPVISSRFFFTQFESKILAWLQEWIDLGSSGISADDLVNSIPNSVAGIIAAISGTTVEEIAQNAVESGTDAARQFASTVAGFFANAIGQIVAFFILLIGVYLALRILGIVLHLIFTKLPGLKTANKILGICVGFLSSVINVWILSTVLIFLLYLIRLADPEFLISFQAEKTILFQFFAALSPIKWML